MKDSNNPAVDEESIFSDEELFANGEKNLNLICSHRYSFLINQLKTILRQLFFILEITII